MTRTFSRAGGDPYGMTEIPDGFGDVDGSGAADELVAYLRYVNDLPWVRASKARSLEALELGPGMRVLDAGSGVGFDACRFAERVGPGGCVVGIDASAQTTSVIATIILPAPFTNDQDRSHVLWIVERILGTP